MPRALTGRQVTGVAVATDVAYASGEGRAGLHVIPFMFGKEVAQAVDAVL